MANKLIKYHGTLIWIDYTYMYVIPDSQDIGDEKFWSNKKKDQKFAKWRICCEFLFSFLLGIIWL